MAAHGSSSTHLEGPRPRWLLWILLLLLGIAIAAGVAVAVRYRSSPSAPAAVAAAIGGPAESWGPGARVAPGFRLRDAHGAPISLAQYRGRNVIVTFVDPLCHTFCPLEAAVINSALRALPSSQRPEVIAVNINPPVRSTATLRKESKRFGWLPQWRWATGSKPQLAAVWKSYQIMVIPTKGDITHTEAAYLIDSKGDQRALFLWPFTTNDILRTYHSLG